MKVDIILLESTNTANRICSSDIPQIVRIVNKRGIVLKRAHQATNNTRF